MDMQKKDLTGQQVEGAARAGIDPLSPAPSILTRSVIGLNACAMTRTSSR